MKILYFLIIFAFGIIFCNSNVGAVSTKISLKKGVGLTIWPPEHCNKSSNPEACKLRLTNGLKALGISWFYNWTKENWGFDYFGNDFNFVPMVWGKGSASDKSYTAAELNQYGGLAQQHPGRYWLIWNELDLQLNDQPDMDNNGIINLVDSAYLAAKIYKPLRDAIKVADPSAKLIIGGISPPTGNRWKLWSEIFLNRYSFYNPGQNPDFDGWHVHLYDCSPYYQTGTWRLKIDGYRKWIDESGGDKVRNCGYLNSDV